MTYGRNIYSSPEKYGFSTFGEIDFAGSYEFDITAVLRAEATGAFFYLSDSGCSCPTPFENTTVEELQPLNSLYEFQQYLNDQRQASHPDLQASIVNLLERLHSAGVR